MVRPGTLRRWQRELLEGGYSPRTVNARISAANGLVWRFLAGGTCSSWVLWR